MNLTISAPARTLTELAGKLTAWTPPPVPKSLGKADAIRLCTGHIHNANTLFPKLVSLAAKAAGASDRVVIGIFGGSGSGKSGTAAVLASYFRSAGVGCYVLSGDHYPHRIPVYNDAERLRIFRAAGLLGMLSAGVYSEDSSAILRRLWAEGLDSSPDQPSIHPWLRIYQQAGQVALAEYLGHPAEQSFEELNAALAAFHAGETVIRFRQLGRTDEECCYPAADLRQTSVLLLEWTHAGSPYLSGVDIPVLLGGTPEETCARRRERGRDPGADSAFVTMVLWLEQQSIDARAHTAALILSVDGRLQSCAQYLAEQEAKRE